MVKREELIAEIRELPFGARPFVCDGFPDMSDIVLIGENPATEMREDWRSFWGDETGFDIERFASAYRESRRLRVEAGLAKGQISPTRKNLIKFRELGLKTLETNVYMNERPKGSGNEPKPNTLLQLLVEPRPNLKAVIVFGGKARRAIKRLNFQFSIKPIFVKHFRPPFWSGAQVEKFARDVIAGNGQAWSR